VLKRLIKTLLETRNNISKIMGSIIEFISWLEYENVFLSSEVLKKYEINIMQL
jgi:hypothetical protein